MSRTCHQIFRITVPFSRNMMGGGISILNLVLIENILLLCLIVNLILGLIIRNCKQMARCRILLLTLSQIDSHTPYIPATLLQLYNNPQIYMCRGYMIMMKVFIFLLYTALIVILFIFHTQSIRICYMSFCILLPFQFCKVELTKDQMGIVEDRQKLL
jgi:hypothetical protein